MQTMASAVMITKKEEDRTHHLVPARSDDRYADPPHATAVAVGADRDQDGPAEHERQREQAIKREARDQVMC